MASPFGRGTPSLQGGSLNFQWNGRKLVDSLPDQVVLPALNEVAKRAEQVWRAHWTPGEHPYMTGEERDEGFFIVEENQQGTTTLIIGSDADHTIFHELGYTRANGTRFEGHHTIGQTVNEVAPTIAPTLRKHAKRAGY